MSSVHLCPSRPAFIKAPTQREPQRFLCFLHVSAFQFRNCFVIFSHLVYCAFFCFPFLFICSVRIAKVHVWDMAGQRRFRVCHPNYQGIQGKNLWMIRGWSVDVWPASEGSWLRRCHHIRHHGQGILQQCCSLGRGEELFVLEASSYIFLLCMFPAHFCTGKPQDHW